MLSIWNANSAFDRVFDDVMRSTYNGVAQSARFQPAVDIRARDEDIVFAIDVPGVRIEDLNVTVEGDVLTVKGARKLEATENERMSLGRPYGEFTLRYTLPDGMDSEHLSADLTNGVLTLRLPKLPKAQPRRIQIGGGGSTPQLTG